MLSQYESHSGAFQRRFHRRMRRLADRFRRHLNEWSDDLEPQGVRPRIVLLADHPRWAFDHVATSIAQRLQRRFDIRVRYVVDRPNLDPAKIDLLYVFYWGETYQEGFDFPAERVIREVASYRWREERNGGLTPEQLVSRHLSNAKTLTTPCRRLWEELRRVHPNVQLCPNTVEFEHFYPGPERTGPLRIGWVGNPRDDTKGLHDILIPATEVRFDFIASTGGWSHKRVARFYREIDVLAIASRRESQPLPLMEAMASGCFIVTTDVGIVTEILTESDAGILMVKRSAEAFATAFESCNAKLSETRSRGRKNAECIRRSRNWDDFAARFAALFDNVLAASIGDSE